MNDLPAFIPNAKIRMYEDDKNLGQRIHDVNDIKQQLIPDFRKLVNGWRLTSEVWILCKRNFCCLVISHSYAILTIW